MNNVIVHVGDHQIVQLEYNATTLRVSVGIEHHDVTELCCVEVIPVSDYPELIADLYSPFGWYPPNVEQFAVAVLGSSAERVALTPTAQEALRV